MLITSARDGTGRLFIVEQTGAIRVYDGGNVLCRPRCSTSARRSRRASEQGLLGLAFHPNFKNNRKFYVDYTNRAGNTIVREYQHVDRATRTAWPRARARTLLRIDQPYANHNGGMLAFGPGRLPVHRHGRRRRRRRPAATGPRTATRCWARCCASTSNARPATHRYAIPARQPLRRPGRPRRDLAARPAQPVALLVRPRDRRPLDRRRRPGPLRGDRPRPPDTAGPRPQLRLARDGGPALLQPVDAAATRPARRCRCSSTRTLERRLRGHRRLRLPRHRRSRRSSAGTCSATTAAARSGRSGRTLGPDIAGHARSARRERTDDQQLRRELRAASCSSSTSAAPSTGHRTGA